MTCIQRHGRSHMLLALEGNEIDPLTLFALLSRLKTLADVKLELGERKNMQIRKTYGDRSETEVRRCNYYSQHGTWKVRG